MNFSRPDADLFTSGGSAPAAALARMTHLCVAAHQDDIEIMAHAGIAECLGRADRAFGGVVVTDGAGSPRVGAYEKFSDEQMRAERREEQRRAAALGRYAIQVQLSHPSAAVKAAASATDVRADLEKIFSGCTPQVVYLHNPADKHDTHVAVLLRCLEALRALPRERRPLRVLGCEVWRDLDWLVDADKVALDAGREPGLAAELLETFASQIAGGKRYDLATLGRRAANATFHTSHAADKLTAITWAMDLTPLVRDETLDIAAFTLAYIERLRADVAARLARFA
ncbi:MAG TPA: PIG-L family deacetylase [Opitutaceae bacterium]|jgi:LmbE family N-acetylglucosaminyl deacetylase|nr:PIG-L family deacetylase [Opitutaceae bacterium]